MARWTWLSIRTLPTALSIPSRCRRTAKILAGGDFTTIGGQTRNYIARLDATTGVADSFDPNANSRVYSIAVQADGKILVGGSFHATHRRTAAQQHRPARCHHRIGGSDPFNPNANGGVLSIAVQADGKILAGGAFSRNIGGQTRNRIARLDATTGPGGFVQPERERCLVDSIAVQADGKILAGGYFTERTASADKRATISPGLIPPPEWPIRFSTRMRTAPVFSIAVQADGKVLAGGEFTGANSIGGQTRNFIARLDATTGAADSFDRRTRTIRSIPSRCRRTARF